jgi:hypothetical protein
MMTKEERKAYNKTYHRTHRTPEAVAHEQFKIDHRKELDEEGRRKRKESNLRYYTKNYETILARNRERSKNTREEDAIRTKQWREENPERVNELHSSWVREHPQEAAIINGKHKAKRRSLGFVPINEPFEGADAHHIDMEHVAYIPRKLHRSMYHNVWTGKNMDKLNALVWEFLALPKTR